MTQHRCDLLWQKIDTELWRLQLRQSSVVCCCFLAFPAVRLGTQLLSHHIKVTYQGHHVKVSYLGHTTSIASAPQLMFPRGQHLTTTTDKSTPVRAWSIRAVSRAHAIGPSLSARGRCYEPGCCSVCSCSSGQHSQTPYEPCVAAICPTCVQISVSSAYDMLQSSPLAAGPSTSQAANSDVFVDSSHPHRQILQDADSINQLLQQAMLWHASCRLSAGALAPRACVKSPIAM